MRMQSLRRHGSLRLSSNSKDTIELKTPPLAKAGVHYDLCARVSHTPHLHSQHRLQADVQYTSEAVGTLS